MSELLREVISELDDRFQTRDRELLQAHSQNREEQEKVASEIGSFEQRLDALVQQQHQFEDQRGSLAEEHMSEVLAVLTQGLKQSASSIVMAASFLLKRLRLVEEQTRLFEGEPELARQYEDYELMDAARGTLPRSYLRFHEAVERRLAPYLQLKDQEDGLRYDAPIFLLIMVALDDEEGVAHWILPFPEESRLPDQGRSVLSDQLMDAMANAVAEVASDGDWELANIMPDLWWSGYPAFAATCKYNGEEKAGVSAEKILLNYFATKSLFRNCELQVNVVQIGLEMWRRGVPGGKGAISERSEAALAVGSRTNVGYYSNEQTQGIAGNDHAA
jgi:hypothetical protein